MFTRAPLPALLGLLMLLLGAAGPGLSAPPTSPAKALAALGAAAARGDAGQFLEGLDAASRDAVERSGRGYDHFHVAEREFAAAFTERFGHALPSERTPPFLEGLLRALAEIEAVHVVESGDTAEAIVRTVHWSEPRAPRLGASDRLTRSGSQSKSISPERVNEIDVLRLRRTAGSWYVILPYLAATLAKAERMNRAATALEEVTAALRGNKIPDESSALAARGKAIRLLSSAAPQNH
jgi:hypothetical protein